MHFGFVRAVLGAAMLAQAAAWCGPAAAQDDLAARYAAADQYFEAVPIVSVLENSIAELAAVVPEKIRGEWVAQMRVLIDKRTLAQGARDVMAKTYTLDEIRALTDFYRSRHGAAIVKKMPAYNAALTPVLTATLKRANERYLEARAGRP